MFTLQSGKQHAIAEVTGTMVSRERGGGGGGPEQGDGAMNGFLVAHSLRAEGHDASEDGTGRGTPLCVSSSIVRRLTPREAERLQGFPDDYTLIPYRRKSAADGPRYKALGNSWAVPCARWIGERIDVVEAIL